jgi:hypothetical protein
VVDRNAAPRASARGAAVTRLTCYDRQGDKGNVTSQVRAMSDSEAGEVADEIFDMFLELHGIQARETQENS